MSRNDREIPCCSPIAIRVPKATKEALERLAAQDSRSLSDYCRIVLHNHTTCFKGLRVNAQGITTPMGYAIRKTGEK